MSKKRYALVLENKNNIMKDTFVRDGQKQPLRLEGPPSKVLKVTSDTTSTTLCNENEEKLAPPADSTNRITVFSRYTGDVSVVAEEGSIVTMHIGGANCINVRGKGNVTLVGSSPYKQKEGRTSWINNGIDVQDNSSVNIENASVGTVTAFGHSKVSVRAHVPLDVLNIYSAKETKHEVADGACLTLNDKRDPAFQVKQPQKRKTRCIDTDCPKVCQIRGCDNFCSVNLGTPSFHLCNICVARLEVAFADGDTKGKK